MKLQDLADKIGSLPTVMSVEDELSLLDQLRQFSEVEIAAHRSAFLCVLEHVVDSHVDAYYEVDESTLPRFLEFVAWIRQLGERLRLDVRGAVNVLTADPATDPTRQR